MLAAAALGIWIAPPATALELPPIAAVQPSDNQALADAVAGRLRDCGLHQFNIDVHAQEGSVELSGTVINADQRELALQAVRSVPGVTQLLDRLAVGGPLTQVQAVAPPPTPFAPGAGPVLGPMPSEARPITPPAANPAAKGGAPMDPVPVYQAPAPHDLTPPKMPPYAWPTYAPYNNYSRVAYPEAYPYNAWPYIGPMYPFPKVPLGWRAVKLEWEDNHWWYSKTATRHDWWRVKYW
jgi:hypothetical protein